MCELKILTQSESAVHFQIQRNGILLSFEEVFLLWEEDTGFVNFYRKSLLSFGFSAYFWEHPGLDSDSIQRPYECILQESKTLDNRTTNVSAFADYLNLDEEAIDFMNLGKNARLVIPTQKLEADIYKHLGSFVRLADTSQINALFQKTGYWVQKEIAANEMIWLNTAGMGVIWLHIRMDTKPKYYKTKNYRRTDFFKSEK